MSPLAAAPLVVLALWGDAAGAAECPGGSHVERDQFYARRAVEMVETALSDDRERLAGQVAAGARFTLWRGDYSSSARDRGVSGAVDFARDLQPRHFEAASVRRGPISVLISDCTWKVTVLFRTSDAGRGVSVQFEFRDGLVTSATGSEVALLSGELR